MGEVEEQDSYRSEIALRNRRRNLRESARRLSMAVFGLMAYSAFANLFSGVMALFSPIDAAVGFILGALYAYGTYRVWVKDDTRWWPVAVPAGLSILLLLLAWAGGVRLPVPLGLNAALLILFHFRKKAFDAVEAVADKSRAAAS